MKTVCQVCNSRFLSSDLLLALNPFDLTEPIHGCPKCKSINSYSSCCELEGCWEEDTCGTPTLNGYKRLCSTHYIQEVQRQEYDKTNNK